MGKIIYVNGHIIVTTNFFLPKEMGCGYQTPPEGAETIEAATDFEGVKCMLIDDRHPLSITPKKVFLPILLPPVI